MSREVKSVVLTLFITVTAVEEWSITTFVLDIYATAALYLLTHHPLNSGHKSYDKRVTSITLSCLQP
jgi:hypothetical protein